jgi:hypothetical protein
MQRRHVDLIDIRAFLAVDFDVHKQIVHHARSRVVLETFMRHDVTPVAGRIAHREQNGLIGLLGMCQGLWAPGPPGHRIGFVLQQIRTCLGGKAIFAGGLG